MGYVAISIREEDLRNGIYLRAGREVIPGHRLVHLYEEDYRSGVLVRGFYTDGELLPRTWTDDSGDYRAHEYPSRQDVGEIEVEMYGGTREEFEHRRELHRRFCEAQGWQQAMFSHHPAWGT